MIILVQANNESALGRVITLCRLGLGLIVLRLGPPHHRIQRHSRAIRLERSISRNLPFPKGDLLNLLESHREIEVAGTGGCSLEPDGEVLRLSFGLVMSHDGFGETYPSSMILYSIRLGDGEYVPFPR